MICGSAISAEPYWVVLLLLGLVLSHYIYGQLLGQLKMTVRDGMQLLSLSSPHSFSSSSRLDQACSQCGWPGFQESKQKCTRYLQAQAQNWYNCIPATYYSPKKITKPSTTKEMIEEIAIKLRKAEQQRKSVKPDTGSLK